MAIDSCFNERFEKTKAYSLESLPLQSGFLPELLKASCPATAFCTAKFS